jgi:glutamine amidotransferase
MITIIDYGVGNINAFINVYKRANVQTKVARNVSDLSDAQKLILPGVGAFDHAMGELQSSGMREMLDELVLEKKVPVIGICVGMQMMGNSSDEGQLKGLNWIDGTVKKFDETKINQITKLPHMGWNDVVPKEGSQLFSGLENTSIFYFLHSFYFHCGNDQDIIATSDYGEKFTCAINHKNMYGIQFHPEKSHHYGEKLLLNFANL